MGHKNSPAFHSYALDWLQSKRVEVRASTWESIYVKRHIVPYFAEFYPSLQVSKLTAYHIQQYLSYKKIGGRMDSQPGGLSKASLKKHKSILHQICDEAVIAGFLHGNPVSAVRIQRGEEIEDRIFLTLEQANEILALFRNHPLHGIVFLTLVYGLRRSEVLGLRWNAIDFEKTPFVLNILSLKA